MNNTSSLESPMWHLWAPIAYLYKLPGCLQGSLPRTLKFLKMIIGLPRLRASLGNHGKLFWPLKILIKKYDSGFQNFAQNCLLTFL